MIPKLYATPPQPPVPHEEETLIPMRYLPAMLKHALIPFYLIIHPRLKSIISPMTVHRAIEAIRNSRKGFSWGINMMIVYHHVLIWTINNHYKPVIL
jgi:hypothetical protein